MSRLFQLGSGAQQALPLNDFSSFSHLQGTQPLPLPSCSGFSTSIQLTLTSLAHTDWPTTEYAVCVPTSEPPALYFLSQNICVLIRRIPTAGWDTDQDLIHSCSKKYEFPLEKQNNTSKNKLKEDCKDKQQKDGIIKEKNNK